MKKTAHHVAISYELESFHEGQVCGDVLWIEKTPSETVILLADGMGHGIKAHISATFYVSRFAELLHRGFSFRDAFTQTVITLHQARGTENPYAVMTCVRILNTGSCVILSYEMPSPLLLRDGYCHIAPLVKHSLGKECIGEYEWQMQYEDGFYLFSDGISQAGMGMGLSWGWGSEGVEYFLRSKPRHYEHGIQSCRDIINQVKFLNKGHRGDDLSIVFARNKEAHRMNIFTGPPSHRGYDDILMKEFWESPGPKVVCGATSAQSVSRFLGKELGMSKIFHSPIEPPAYDIQGIDLATEGAVTLNQVYRLLGELTDPDPQSPVHALCDMLQQHDTIRIWCGTAQNTGNQGVRFKQMGVLSRGEILPKIVDKLREMGKLVELIEY